MHDALAIHEAMVDDDATLLALDLERLVDVDPEPHGAAGIAIDRRIVLDRIERRARSLAGLGLHAEGARREEPFHRPDADDRLAVGRKIGGRGVRRGVQRRVPQRAAVGEVRRANLAARRFVPSRIAVDRDLRAGREALGRQAVARQHAARRHLAAPRLRVARGVDDVDVDERVRIDEVEFRDDAFEVDGLRGVVVRRDAVMRETRRRQDESQ